MAAHGITKVLPTYPTLGPASKDYMSQFDRHFDNLAAAATNSGASFYQLAATTTTQYMEIKALLATLNTASNRASRSSSYATSSATDSTPLVPPTEAKWRIIQLEAAVCNNWHCGYFCSAHGWGVNENHTSENCRAKKSGHFSTATCDHPAGPGKAINKGWENFLSTRRVSTRN